MGRNATGEALRDQVFPTRYPGALVPARTGRPSVPLPRPVLLELAIERLAVHRQEPRGRRAIAAGGAQRAQDVLALDVRQGQRPFRRHLAARGAPALERVLELAHVAGPAVATQRFQRLEN